MKITAAASVVVALGCCFSLLFYCDVFCCERKQLHDDYGNYAQTYTRMGYENHTQNILFRGINMYRFEHTED